MLEIIFIENTVLPSKINIPKSYAALSDDIIVKIGASSAWVQTNYHSYVWPVAVSSAISMLTTFMIYFDSDVPGQSPPTPFSPSKNLRYTEQSYHIYLTYVTTY